MLAHAPSIWEPSAQCGTCPAYEYIYLHTHTLLTGTRRRLLHTFLRMLSPQGATQHQWNIYTHIYIYIYVLAYVAHEFITCYRMLAYTKIFCRLNYGPGP